MKDKFFCRKLYPASCHSPGRGQCFTALSGLLLTGYSSKSVSSMHENKAAEQIRQTVDRCFKLVGPHQHPVGLVVLQA